LLSPLLQQSDKFFWHDYIDFYEKNLPNKITGHIVEFGVFKGNSIRWLLERFPQAEVIWGLDILPVQNSWPKDPRVMYNQVDQGSETDVANFFKRTPSPELIIEDGSHIPSHQARCLKYGMSALKPGGLYILEDIHTSIPGHQLFNSELSTIPRLVQSFFSRLGLLKNSSAFQNTMPTALSVLLAIEQNRRLGLSRLNDASLKLLSIGSNFSDNDIRSLDEQISDVFVYKRATLPRACYSCGSTVFDYNRFVCSCGTGVFDHTDSMAILIKKWH